MKGGGGFFQLTIDLRVSCCSWSSVFFKMALSNSAYLVNLCIGLTKISISLRRLQSFWVSHHWKSNKSKPLSKAATIYTHRRKSFHTSEFIRNGTKINEYKGRARVWKVLCVSVLRWLLTKSFLKNEVGDK